MAPELIDRARQNIQQKEENRLQQEQANALCSQMRLDLIKFLEENGTRRSRTIDRIFSPFILNKAVSQGLSPFNIVDWVSLSRSVNGTSEPIQVGVSSSTAIPSKSEMIDIRIEGHNEFISLSKRGGRIFSNWSSLPVDIPQSREHSMDGHRREATLNDAQQYEQIVDLLLQR